MTAASIKRKTRATGAKRPSSLGASAASTYSQKQTGTIGASPHNALNRARRTRCPNSRGYYIWSLSTDQAAELPCRRWDCSYCQQRKRAAAQRVIRVGLETAWGRGERVRFMTLTDDSAGELTVAGLYDAWNRLRARLTRDRRDGRYVNEYAAVVEVQTRGALHLHVLMTGRYIKQRDLVGMALDAGFGRCTDIREVKQSRATDARGSADYVTKQLAGYLTKQAAAALGDKTNERRRPLRTSRGWADGLSLRKAEQQMAQEMRDRATDQGEEPDTGPFAFVQVFANGDVVVRIGEHTELQIAAPHDPDEMPFDGELWLEMYAPAATVSLSGTKPTAEAAAPPPGRATASAGAFAPARAAPARRRRR